MLARNCISCDQLRADSGYQPLKNTMLRPVAALLRGARRAAPLRGWTLLDGSSNNRFGCIAASAAGGFNPSDAPQSSRQQRGLAASTQVGAVTAPSRPPPMNQSTQSPPGQQGKGQQPGDKLQMLKDGLAMSGITLSSYAPGQYSTRESGCYCPACGGGGGREKNFVVTISKDSESAVWICNRKNNCGKTGGWSLTRPPKPSPRQGKQLVSRETGKEAESQRDATASSERAQAELQRYNSIIRDIAVETSSGEVEAAPGVPKEILDFFFSRGLSIDTVHANRVGWGGEEASGKGPHVAFRYYKDKKLVNIKFRSVREKSFWGVSGAPKCLYGLDDVPKSDDQLIFVEGEMDKLAYWQAGIMNVVSVPNGAVNKASAKADKQLGPALDKRQKSDKPADDEEVSADKAFSYIWEERKFLDRMKNIIIATDDDSAGQNLAEELARRLRKERCWRVHFSTLRKHGAAALEGEEDGGKGEEDGTGGIVLKDANDVLLHEGNAKLVELTMDATRYPIRGLHMFKDYEDDLWNFYNKTNSDDDFGVSSGWETLDMYYKVVPGELTIVTGVPNSGKSEWIDALLVNLALRHEWSFAMCSMENRVRDHFRKLAEKFTEKSFFNTWYAEARPSSRMTPEDLGQSIAWLNDHFFLIRHEDENLPNIDWVLDKAREAVTRHGIRGLVIDPYNELEHTRPSGRTETEYVSEMLSKVKRFAQNHGVHVWFVAHPRQMQNWQDQPPGLYDISGSAHFVNKADNGIVVHRYRQDPAKKDGVEIHIQKVRNKMAGTLGMITLGYKRSNGTYFDHPEELAMQRKAFANSAASSGGGGG